MADTRPNIVVPPMTVVDIYAVTGITVGEQILIEMHGTGDAFLYSGASLSGRPNNSTGYTQLFGDEFATNDVGDLGAFIWSDQGCTINVSEV